MNRNNLFKVGFSLSFIIIALLVLFCDWFRDRIDSRFIALIIIAYLPWVFKYLRSVEAFGIKADLTIPQEEKEKMDKSEDSIKKEFKISKKMDNTMEIIYNLDEIRNTSTKLALIRIDIERTLKKLCKKNSIDRKIMTIPYMVNELRRKEIINNQAANLLLDILPILNNAVHSNLNGWKYTDSEWVEEKGKFLLSYLNSI